jgi:hypothetical protein
MSETKLLARIQDVVGSGDTVLAAASFEQRGQAGGFVGGGMAGDSIGQALGGTVGEMVGNAVGTVVGLEEAQRRGGFGAMAQGELQPVPLFSTVAASATKLYAWSYEMHHGHLQPTDPIFVLDRSETVVAVHARMVVHTFEVAHPPSNRRWEFEADRVGSHLKDLMEVLDVKGAPVD